MGTATLESRGARIVMSVGAVCLAISMETACASRDLLTGAAAGKSSNLGADVASASSSDLAAEVASGAAMRVLHWQRGSIINRRGRPTIALFGTEAEAQVDRETGILVKYYACGEHRRTEPGTQGVTAEQALASARAFAERAGVPPDAWCLRDERYLDHGALGREYSVQWVKMMAGVKLPAAIDVDVDAETGDVYSFTLADDPVVVPLQPRISVDQAAAVVATRMGYRQPIAELAELTVWYRPSYPGRQVLLWRFDNMCDAPAPGDTLLRAYVDATTGELVSLMRKLGSSTPGMKHSGEQEKVDSSDKPAPVLIRAFKKVDMPALKNATPPPTVFQSARPRKK